MFHLVVVFSCCDLFNQRLKDPLHSLVLLVCLQSAAAHQFKFENVRALIHYSQLPPINKCRPTYPTQSHLKIKDIREHACISTRSFPMLFLSSGFCLRSLCYCLHLYSHNIILIATRSTVALYSTHQNVMTHFKWRIGQHMSRRIFWGRGTVNPEIWEKNAKSCRYLQHREAKTTYFTGCVDLTCNIAHLF